MEFAAMPFTVSEGPVVCQDGLLRIDWPEQLPEEALDDSVDILLATVTKPTLTSARYPSTREVADRWLAREAGQERYFFRNVECGIRTFQDPAIWQRLERSSAAEKYAAEYSEAVSALQVEGTRSV